MEIERLVVSQDDLIEIGKELRRQNIYYVSGSYSIFCQSWGKKYLNQAVVRKWPDQEGELVDMLPGEAARTEMFREWPLLKKVGWSGPMIKLLDKCPPMHYGGTKKGEFIQVDLSGAYYQIYRLLWLDVSYPGGFYGKYPLYKVAERLKGWKTARNAVIGIARSTKTTGVKGDRRMYVSTTNRYLSPNLWATCQDILHFIAWEAVQNGAIYVNTDGYIFPYRSPKHEFFTETLRKMGLSYRIEAVGEGEILGWNSYQVGHKRTKPYRLKMATRKEGFTNVKRPQTKSWYTYLQRCRSIVGLGPNPND